MNKIQYAIENNPGRSMVISGLAGLAFPYGSIMPDGIIVVVLATMIFLSCFRINTPLPNVFSWRLALFCLARFAVLPVLLWFVFKAIAPAYALGVLLLALCPAGASSAALTGLYNGNVTLAFVITIISSIACVFLIPFTIGSLNHTTVDMSVFVLLKTLALCILLPGCLYLLLRRRVFLISYSHNYGRLTTVVIISFVTFFVLAKKRDYFLGHPQDIVMPLLVGFVVYAFAAILGFAMKASPAERVAYGVCSTFNNTALGIGLALLYFDDTTILIMIATEITWAFLPMLVQPLIKRLSPA